MEPAYKEPAIVVKELDQWAIGFVCGAATTMLFILGVVISIGQNLK